MKKTIHLVLLLVALISMAFTDIISQSPQLDQRESKIKELIQERVERHHQEFGLVVGIVSERGRQIISYGKQRRGGKAVDGDTLFELCSVTKVFTSLLLADMVRRGEVNLDDPIEKYLPPEVKVPSRNGIKITSLHLATHTSGLPNTPQIKSGEESIPGYINFSEHRLYNFLSNYTLSREPGTQFEYSNLGFGLLGHVLFLKAGKSYDQQVEERICRPLGMTNTRRKMTPALNERLAVGYFLDGQQAKNYHMPPVLAGAGGLRSTAHDMLTFLAANMGLESSPLLNAMQATHKGRFPIAKDIVKIGFAWIVAQQDDFHIVFHGGEKDGYRAFIGFDPGKKIGVVVFANFQERIDDIGLYSLSGERDILKLGEYTEEPKQVQVNPEVYNDYAGTYQTTPTFFIVVTREGDRLFAQGTGQPKFELFPESETTFFLKAVRAKIIFERDRNGKVFRLIVRSSEGDEISKKIK
ncbi:MAG: serine hydrolase [Candidatus Aminicenantes bacterium]|nr:MAG: serine hydrolase [Candidatus Aminicenantes bacterium]